MFRPRRLRKNEMIRSMVRENHLSVKDFIYPLFVEEGENVRKEIATMPGVFRYSLDQLDAELKEIVELEIPSIMLFGIPKRKDEIGSESWNDEAVVQTAIRYIKQNYPQLYVIADVCFCEYTSHGHCGILVPSVGAKDGMDVDNDQTLNNLKKQSLSMARAGADLLAPSGMMDGMIATMRDALDLKNFSDIPIMSYAVKYASAFYGPFRDAADSAPSLGDRKTYQMDPANRIEALKEAALDVAEGADILMVKPALSYLDIIRELKDTHDLPLAAYNVSGEYAMLKAAAQNGWIDGEKVMMEKLISMKRAGADIILTYHAKEAARLL
ncbi:porphobilinogen synthase [Vicingaceae bacterium]|nr:porphobilinogen synthase [Vicingaceae bacterium]MDB9963743.1 porphobilinogen synthase [Vicingaceae bacterium]MDC1450914.1 porphobilinogen synthase [Vicingaceae bacterium]